MPFSWNEKKAAQNRHKHGVSFDEALSCFFDPLGVEYQDTVSDARETRFVRRAHSSRGRLLIVVFAERGELVRIISARKATKHEAEMHAQGI